MDKFVKDMMFCMNFIWYADSQPDGHGTIIKNDPVNMKGYSYGKKEIVYTKSGEQLITSKVFIVDEINALRIRVNDKIQLPGSEILYPVKTVDPFYKEHGILDYGIVYLE